MCQLCSWGQHRHRAFFSAPRQHTRVCVLCSQPPTTRACGHPSSKTHFTLHPALPLFSAYSSEPIQKRFQRKRTCENDPVLGILGTKTNQRAGAVPPGNTHLFRSLLLFHAIADDHVHHLSPKPLNYPLETAFLS